MVSLRLHRKFDNVVNKWKSENVTSDEESKCKDWLIGNSDGNKQCKTVIDNTNNLERAPYYEYNKYVVSYPGGSQSKTDTDKVSDYWIDLVFHHCLIWKCNLLIIKTAYLYCPYSVCVGGGGGGVGDVKYIYSWGLKKCNFIMIDRS